MKRSFIALALICHASLSHAACVKSLTREAPDHRYQVEGAVAIDSHTNLMWARCPLGLQWSNDNNRCQPNANNSPLTFTWGEALTAASNTVIANYSDWRLPNKNELASLIDRGCTGPALNNVVFTSGNVGFWTSTPGRREDGYAWHINFLTGTLINRSIDNLFYVRLVRDN